MLFRYFTEKLLGLQDILIENIEEIDGSIHIYCKLELKMHEYPVCGKHTDIPAFGKFISPVAQIPFFRVTPTNSIDIEQKKHPTLMCGVLEIIFLLMLSRFT